MTRTSALAALGCALSLATLGATLGVLASPAPAAAAALAANLDVPTITCFADTTDYIDVEVCAGPSGARGGFSVHWIRAADLAANGGVWPATDGSSTAFNASFSGRAFGSRYDLEPNECVTVRIGELLLDNGASTRFPEKLQCDTEYAFRVFAHAAGGGVQRSAFSDTVTCTTAPCTACDPGVHSLSYWVENFPAWPADSLSLGGQFYWDFELYEILTTPAGDNGYLILAHQVITTELNTLGGASMEYYFAIADDLGLAHVLIGQALIPPIGDDTVTDEAAAPYAATALALDATRAEFECEQPQ